MFLLKIHFIKYVFLKNMQKSLLIIFTRTPEIGKVKRRLAIKFGDAKALEIHNKLFANTLDVANTSNISNKIYLSEEPESAMPFNYQVQLGNDLGERMHNAILNELKHFDKVCLIGSDCLSLNSSDIENAFIKLDSTDIVIGPAVDGGYYLIGMKKPQPMLFSGIYWGTSSVLKKTLEKCANEKLLVDQLKLYNDIDRPEDVPDNWL